MYMKQKNKIYLKHMIIGSSNSALNVEKSGVKVALKTGRDLTEKEQTWF